MANKLIHDFLENSAARFPDKVALIREKRRATYRQVNADADRFAAFLAGRGVKKGDRVVIMLENSLEYVVSYYGILKAGAVAVPLSTDLKPDGLNPLLAELEPSAMVSYSRFERLLQASDLDVPNLNTLIIQNPKLNWNKHRIAVFSFEETTHHPQSTTNNPQQATCYPTPPNDQIIPSDLANIIYTSGSTGRERFEKLLPPFIMGVLSIF